MTLEFVLYTWHFFPKTGTQLPLSLGPPSTIHNQEIENLKTNGNHMYIFAKEAEHHDIIPTIQYKYLQAYMYNVYIYSISIVYMVFSLFVSHFLPTLNPRREPQSQCLTNEKWEYSWQEKGKMDCSSFVPYKVRIYLQ